MSLDQNIDKRVAKDYDKWEVSGVGPLQRIRRAEAELDGDLEGSCTVEVLFGDLVSNGNTLVFEDGTNTATITLANLGGGATARTGAGASVADVGGGNDAAEQAVREIAIAIKLLYDVGEFLGYPYIVNPAGLQALIGYATGVATSQVPGRKLVIHADNGVAVTGTSNEPTVVLTDILA